MEQDTFKTEVIFRKWEGEIIALFPYNIEDYKSYNMRSSYMHVGQHSAADYSHIIDNSKPAEIVQYLDLKRELESIGYNLQVIQKRHINKAMAAFKEAKKQLVNL